MGVGTSTGVGGVVRSTGTPVRVSYGYSDRRHPEDTQSPSGYSDEGPEVQVGAGRGLVLSLSRHVIRCKYNSRNEGSTKVHLMTWEAVCSRHVIGCKYNSRNEGSKSVPDDVAEDCALSRHVIGCKYNSRNEGV